MKSNAADDAGSDSNDEEVDILGDMASDDEEPRQRSRRNLVPRRPEISGRVVEGPRGSRNRNGLNGMPSETLENNSVNVGINLQNKLNKDEDPK